MGGGPSLHETYWRHRLTTMPSIAINHHAFDEEGISTDYFVQSDPPNPGAWTPIGVLEDQNCVKFFYEDHEDKVSQYPNVCLVKQYRDFDAYRKWMLSDAGHRAYTIDTLCTTNLCIRIASNLGFTDLYLIGIDLRLEGHDLHREWFKAMVPELKRLRGMNFYSLARDNDVDQFQSAS